MEPLIKITKESTGNKILKSFALLFLFIETLPYNAAAQADTSNISKVLDAKRKADHEELMSYVYMTVGFIIVIGVAWFTTSLAKKQRLKSDAEKAQKVAMRQAQNPHVQAHRRR